MYNLRSVKNNTVELPVEIQLTGDKTFIETVLKIILLCRILRTVCRILMYPVVTWIVVA